MEGTLKLKHVGENWSGHKMYQDERGNYYHDINIFAEEKPRVLYASVPLEDPDGEPDRMVTDFEIIN